MGHGQVSLDDDLAAIFYTSGTTGVPKGALPSHRDGLANNVPSARAPDLP